MNKDFHRRDEQPRVKGVHVADSAKTTQIRDINNNLRYDVVFNSKVMENDGGMLIIGYFIEVFNYVYGLPSRIPFLRIPEKDDEFIYDYDKAKHAFDTCVQRYSSLVRAEVKDFQDITIYKEKIGYEKTCPRCCQTCKWAIPRETPGDIIIGVSKKFECHNPKNEDQYRYDIEFPGDKDHRYRKKPSWSRLPWACDDTNYELEDRRQEPLNRIFPRVDPLGVCDNYEKRKEKYHPVDGDSVVDLVDSRVDYRFENLDSDPKFVVAVSSISYPITKEYVDTKIDTLSSDPKFEKTISSMVSSMTSVVIVPAIDKRIVEKFPSELSGNLSIVYNNVDIVDGNPIYKTTTFVYAAGDSH